MIWTGFALGFFGGLHCVSMCGPLMLALSSKSYSVWHLILHHVFRWAGYVLLAFIFRLVVSPIAIFGAQQYIAIASGVLLLLFGLKTYIPFLNTFFTFLSNKIAGLMPSNQNSVFQKMTLGVLNGLLPCGLSFGAAIISVNFESFYEASSFMILFGIGTLPLLLGVSLLPKMGGQSFLKKINNWIPKMLIITGILLIIRGAGLGIPYFSPKFNKQNNHAECCER